MTVTPKKELTVIGSRALENERLDRPDALFLSELARDDPWELMHWAYRVRVKNFANTVRLCSIVPGKLGGCPEDCKWCAQSIHSSAPEAKRPQRTTIDEIHRTAKSAHANHAASMGIVNSGYRPTQHDLDEVVGAIRKITSDNNCEIELCASLGELTDEQARQLAQAGLTRYHHNLETSRAFFAQVVTTHGYEQRIETLKAAQRAGMKTCSGALLGMGETWEDRIDLALTIRDEVDPDVIPLNFLQPLPGTPLESAETLKPIEALAIIAIFRLILPNVDLKVAGGREHNLRNLQSWIFYAGATSTMVGNYLTTTGRDAQTDLQMIEDLGLTIVKEFPTQGP